MKAMRLFYATLFVGLSCCIYVGCGESPSNVTTKTSSDDRNAEDSSLQQSPLPVSTQASNEATNQKTNETTSQVPKQTPNELTVKSEKSKPTKEQLTRWQYRSVAPLELLDFRENELVGAVAFVGATTDGKKFVLGGTRLTLWNLESDEQVFEFIKANTKDEENLVCFAVSPVEDWCAAVNATGILRTFDLRTGKEIASQDTGMKNITCLAVSPDGKEIATTRRGNDVAIWYADTLESKNQFKIDARDVTDFQYVSPSVLIQASDSVSSWDTATGTKLKTYTTEKVTSGVSLSSNGKELIFGTNNSLVRWNLTEDRVNGEYRGVPFRNSAVRFTSDGSMVAIATGEAIRILDAETGQNLQWIDASDSTICDACWIPNTHLLLVGSDVGPTRIWGRPDEGAKYGYRPLHTPVNVERANPEVPTSVAENLAVVDVRLLPKLPDAKPQPPSFNSVTYTAPVGIDEAKAFYRYTLGERDWSEATDQSSPTTMQFQKNGFALTISWFGEKPTETSMTLSMSSNYDCRKSPKLEKFIKEETHASQSTVSYKVSASLLDIETELLRSFHQAGWTAVVRLVSRQNDPSDGRQLEFMKSGTSLRAWVQPDKNDASLFVVTYSLALAQRALPVPPDAGLIEWDGTREAQMVANTSLKLSEATAFYENAMKKQGWLPRKNGRRIDEKVVYLPYFSGQQDVTIALEPFKDGLVRIRAGKYSEYSWQKPDEEAAIKSAADAKATSEDGIQAADLPILHAAGVPRYESERGGNITIELEKISLIALSKEYETLLKATGWTAKPFGDPSEDRVGIHFEKGTKIIYYESSIDPRGGKSVRFSGNGLLWTKTIVSEKLTSYSAWLRNHKYPATLKRLDEYQSQMKELLGEIK
jgi:hypothetical protein